MGYGVYEMNGRWQGYGVPAICDHPDCDEKIDRGMSHSCGGSPTENCGLFFCAEHLCNDVDPEAEYTSDNRHNFSVCERCVDPELTSFSPKLDMEFWKAWLMNHETWKSWREENPKFVQENLHLIGHEEVMAEIALEE